MSDNNNNNTLGSYVDSATGYAKQTVGSATGSNQVQYILLHTSTTTSSKKVLT